jgi:phospholipid-binding lipoprotein MlaA
MKPRSYLAALLVLTSVTFLTSCASTARKSTDDSGSAAAGVGPRDAKSVQTKEDDLDEYAASSVADPLEPINRVTFWLNDGIYRIVLRPLSKGYELVIPKVVRTGIYNAYENVKYPVRLVNNVLQGNLPGAGQETGKFLVNSTLGLGGILLQSDKFPALAHVPDVDTGQTFGRWGIGQGAYLVLPLLGPSTLRDTVGLAGDYALNPVTWVGVMTGGFLWTGSLDWTVSIPAVNTLRSLPEYMDNYDAATEDALDRYLAARSVYIQYRAEVISK